MAIRVSTSEPAITHSSAFRWRRALNWFPLGLTYAFLYMGRYNLTVAKNSLGELMTKEDFGLIFGAGTVTYALSFILNGPLVDRIGGRRGILIGAAGSMFANAAMGVYLWYVISSEDPTAQPLLLVFSALYAVNMYFQSYGAVSIVKVNAHWFHVSERGGFSGIFGTMISSGIFLAFTVNGWLLDLAGSWWPGTSSASRAWVVFAFPAVLLGLAFLVETFLLQDRPSGAGHEDFDTGDASSGDDDNKPLPTLLLFKRIFSNPIILTIAAIEFCTGILRNGVMHWFPIYAKEIWVLPSEHMLRVGSWENVWLIVGCFAVAAISWSIAGFAKRGKGRAYLIVMGALAFLMPFFQGGWGGLLMVSGVIGGNVAGWVSDLFFQSRRGPAAAGLYGVLGVLTLAMAFVLAKPTNVVFDSCADLEGDEVATCIAGLEATGLRAGDVIESIAGHDDVEGWADVRNAVACWEPRCVESRWDPETCMCSTRRAVRERPAIAEARTIPATVERDGQRLSIELPDPKAVQQAGDLRLLAVRPVLPLSPYVLGVLVFLMSLCVIGTHGLLSGTATMDFGGRKGAATAVGVIDGFVYLGTALQSVALGYLTTRDWGYWPWFLLPFAVIGFLLCLRIWNAKPGSKGAH